MTTTTTINMRRPCRYAPVLLFLSLGLLLSTCCLVVPCDAFGISLLPLYHPLIVSSRHTTAAPHYDRRGGGFGLDSARTVRHAASSSDIPSSDETTTTSTAAAVKPPTLNGKMVLPYKVLQSGLEGHTIAAVYAVLNASYKRGNAGDGWEHCEHVGMTRHLHETLEGHRTAHGPQQVAHVRALSFSFPQVDAMRHVVSEWNEHVQDAGGSCNGGDGQWNDDDDEWMENMEQNDDRAALVELMEKTAYLDDDDDDDDEWDEEEDELRSELQAASPSAEVVSPFETNKDKATTEPIQTSTTTATSSREFTVDTVDEILDEIRPYLIADGGNVAVDRVDPVNKDVYLILEGACGSCPSSTVTMQMGIERVLKENFADLGQVLQVQQADDAAVTGLTYDAVESEVTRIKPAIIAMGGVVQIVDVDTDLGVVKLKFRGANKVRSGVELAIRDVDYVKHVEFVMEE